MNRTLSLAAAIALAAPAVAAPPPVTAAAYHPQGKAVAFGTHGEVRLFDPATGAPIGKLPGQTGRVTALAFDPSGRWLAAASGEPGKSGAVRLYGIDAHGRSSGPGPTLTAHA